MSNDPCIICHLVDQPTAKGSTDRSYKTICARCGTYEWDLQTPERGRSKRVVSMSGYVRDQNVANIVPIFTPDLVRMVELLPKPVLRERASRLLTAIVSERGYNLREPFSLREKPMFLAVSYSGEELELDLLLQVLEGGGSVTMFTPQGALVGRLNPSGCLEAEELRQRQPATVQGFIAMSFDQSLSEAYANGFDPAIRAAGYRPLRIDGMEHAGSISDAIVSEIRRSRFLVADYTLSNNGVYFEAGLALGLGIPVIPTCKSDWLDKLHFDIRHINTLKWESSTELSASLARRVSAVIGDGPLPKPV